MMPPISGLQCLLVYPMLVLLLALLNIFIINLKLIIITVFYNNYTRIWKGVQLGNFLQSHDSTIKLAAIDLFIELLFFKQSINFFRFTNISIVGKEMWFFKDLNLNMDIKVNVHCIEIT